MAISFHCIASPDFFSCRISTTQCGLPDTADSTPLAVILWISGWHHVVLVTGRNVGWSWLWPNVDTPLELLFGTFQGWTHGCAKVGPTVNHRLLLPPVGQRCVHPPKWRWTNNCFQIWAIKTCVYLGHSVLNQSIKYTRVLTCTLLIYCIIN